MIALDDAAQVAAAGHKARVLGEARRRGLPVLDGFVVLPGERVDEAELAAALARLGAERFVVRSSASVEDGAGWSAAGVFESVVGVAAAEVPAAIERVRSSARSPAAVWLAALAAQRSPSRTEGSGAAATDGGARERIAPAAPPDAGSPHEAPPAAAEVAGPTAAAIEMAVLVQPLATASRLGVLHARGGRLLVEERAPEVPEWGEAHPRELAGDDPLRDLATRAAEIVGGPVDLEYALTAAGPLLLQARPLTVDAGAVEAEAPDPGDDASYRLDAEHNPAPLTAAQASLVALIDDLPSTVRQRVIAGYLYTTKDGARGPGDVPPPRALRRRYDEEIRPACEARLVPLEGLGGEVPLGASLDAFREVAARTMGQVAPSLAMARRELDELLRATLGEALATHGALLGGCGGETVARDQALWEIGRARASTDGGETAPGSARRPTAPDDEGALAGGREADTLVARFVDRFGAHAPAWDVGAVPDDEAPERVLAAAALVARGPSPRTLEEAARAHALAVAAALSARMPAEARASFAERLSVAREVAPIHEDDDLLFLRAQRLVRRALVARGRALVAAGRLDAVEDVFDLPLDVVVGARTPAASAERDRMPSDTADASDAAQVDARAAGGTGDSWAHGDVGGAGDLRAPARAARELRRMRARGRPPLRIVDRVASPPDESAGDALRGAGTPGRARGRVLVIDAATVDPALAAGAVIVVAAMLPSLTWLLPRAAALVTDHGGALSHGATLAREYGVPAVLGARRATATLADGDDVLVDGDAGLVLRLGRRAPPRDP